MLIAPIIHKIRWGVFLGSYTDVGFDNPSLSAAAWSAYQSNSIQVNSLLTATASQTTLNGCDHRECDALWWGPCQ